MRIEELDIEAKRLGAMVATAGANLVELDSDTTKKILEGTSLTGESKRRWDEAGEWLANLWPWYFQLDDLIKRYSAKRAEKRLSSDEVREMENWLLGPSITLNTTAVPLGARSLLGSGASQVMCRPDELLGKMNEGFQLVVACIDEAGHALSFDGPRAGALGARLERVKDDVSPNMAKDLIGRVDAVAASIMRDPLGGDRTKDLDALERQVVELETQAAQSLGARNSLGDRLASARGRLSAVLRVLNAADKAARTAAEKVQGTFGAPAFDPALLAEIRRIEGSSSWREQLRDLGRWETQLANLEASAKAALSVADGALGRRDEMRGLLESYKAKAAKTGQAERAGLFELEKRATELLYSAPCDLSASASALDAYTTTLKKTREDS